MEDKEMDEMINTARKICHDINQPLTVIMARSELMLIKMGDDDVNRKAAEQIHEQSLKMSDLVEQLRSHLKNFQSE